MSGNDLNQPLSQVAGTESKTFAADEKGTLTGWPLCSSNWDLIMRIVQKAIYKDFVKP